MIPNAAGVEKYDIGAGLAFRRNIAAAFEYTGYFFGIVLVHLAAVSLDKICRLSAGQVIVYSFRSLSGAVKLALWYGNIFTHKLPFLYR